MLVRMVGVEPYLTSIKSRVPDRQATFAYKVDQAYSPRVVPHFYSVPNRRGLVHIYIPQPRGDLAVRCLWREGLTHSRGCCPFFRVAFPHLCVLIIAHFVEFVKGFLKKIATFFQRLFPIHYGCGCDTPSLRSCIPTGLDSNLSSALPS